jgi:branched-chain amino acid transport system substrate-binding protein
LSEYPQKGWEEIVTRAAVVFCIVALLGLLAQNEAASAEVPGHSITIGVLTDIGGPYSDVSGTGSVLAAQMAIEDFGGKVLGKPIRLVSADHQNNPDLAVSIAREWFDNQGVNLIVDLPNSAVALAVQNLAREKARITIVSSASTDVLTNKQCSPTGAHWTFDSYSAGKVIAQALAKPGSSWFFLTVDYVGGTSLQNSATPFIQAAGGRIVGSVRHPLNASDMSSYLLQAQSSGAQYVALASSGSDAINAVKQAREFRLTSHGQQMVGIVVFLTDLKAMGLEVADGRCSQLASPQALARRQQHGHDGSLSGTTRCQTTRRPAFIPRRCIIWKL